MSLAINQTQTFNYTGNVQSITLLPGIYKFEAYGASGGGEAVGARSSLSYGSVGGLGGRATATFILPTYITIYVYVGGAGYYNYDAGTKPTGGWNGGGNGGNRASGSGGGATDFRIIGGAWNNIESLYSRFLVAGGGGGTDNWNGGTTSDDGSGGSGGGIEGQGAWINGSYQAYYRGTQTSGYALGQGEHASVNTDTGGAGGGWYGGRATNNNNGGAGGGSGYIKGYNGCNTDYVSYQGDLSIYQNQASFALNARNGNGLATITCLDIYGNGIIHNYLQNLNQTDYDFIESFDSFIQISTIQNENKTYQGFTLNTSLHQLDYDQDLQKIFLNCYYTRNSYTLTVIDGTSDKYTYLYEEKGNLKYNASGINNNYLLKFKCWKSDDFVDIQSINLKNTTFKMPAQNITIYADSTNQDRVNTNIYKNIFETLLFDLYQIQSNLSEPYAEQNTIFQYNHGLSLYDLVRINDSGIYEKGLANEEKYNVVGIVSQVINNNEFVLLINGQLPYNGTINSLSGILYLSDTQLGEFCTFEELTTDFYTPIGFYTDDTITINILDSSVGAKLKKYQETVYTETNLVQLTEAEKQDIIQEVLNNA